MIGVCPLLRCFRASQFRVVDHLCVFVSDRVLGVVGVRLVSRIEHVCLDFFSLDDLRGEVVVVLIHDAFLRSAGRPVWTHSCKQRTTACSRGSMAQRGSRSLKDGSQQSLAARAGLGYRVVTIGPVLEDAMHARYLVAAGSVLAVTLLIAAPAAAQSREWQPPRTPDGKPDLQGTFTFRTITPLQRPAALAGKDKLTPEEAAKFEASENLRLNRDLYDPEKGQPSAGLSAAIARRRALLQRLLVRARQPADRRQADVAHRRSARRPHPVRAAHRRRRAQAPAASTRPRPSASPTAASSGSIPGRR